MTKATFSVDDDEDKGADNVNAETRTAQYCCCWNCRASKIHIVPYFRIRNGERLDSAAEAAVLLRTIVAQTHPNGAHRPSTGACRDKNAEVNVAAMVSSTNVLDTTGIS